MGKKKGSRESRDIRACILSLAIKKGGVTRTQMFYRCNLSWRMTKAHSTALLQDGMLASSTKNPKFTVTEKGRAWLNAYKKMRLINEAVTKNG